MAKVTGLCVGESLIGEGNEVAHIDLLIGPRGSAAETAFANCLTNNKDGFTSLLAVVARDAVELLTDPVACAALRQCAGDNCAIVYLDTSRGRRRRWCSSDTCGNRERVARHRRDGACLPADHRHCRGEPDLRGARRATGEEWPQPIVDRGAHGGFAIGRRRMTPQLQHGAVADDRPGLHPLVE